MKISELFTLCKGPLTILKVRDEGTDLIIEGEFETPLYLQLTADQQRLVDTLIMYGGNLKKVAEEIEVSYPTLKGRLDEISTLFQNESQKKSDLRSEILEAVGAGELTAEEAIEKIKELQ